jgi:Domain of unknown function (DUF4126)
MLAVDALIALGRTVPFAFASGINLYATVAVLGLCSRFHIVALPDQFKAFEHPLIISVALVMYVVEFVADKVPWFDSLWDTIHTVVRPIGGALVAVTALGDASAGAQAVAALLGGSVAMTTHLGKAGTRAVANTSPEPFSNWALSLGEDAIAIGLTYFAIQHPLLALAIAVFLLVAIVACATVLLRSARSRFGRRSSRA